MTEKHSRRDFLKTASLGTGSVLVPNWLAGLLAGGITTVTACSKQPKNLNYDAIAREVVKLNPGGTIIADNGHSNSAVQENIHKSSVSLIKAYQEAYPDKAIIFAFELDKTNEIGTKIYHTVKSIFDKEYSSFNDLDPDSKITGTDKHFYTLCFTLRDLGCGVDFIDDRSKEVPSIPTFLKKHENRLPSSPTIQQQYNEIQASTKEVNHHREQAMADNIKTLSEGGAIIIAQVGNTHANNIMRILEQNSINNIGMLSVNDKQYYVKSDSIDIGKQSLVKDSALFTLSQRNDLERVSKFYNNVMAEKNPLLKQAKGLQFYAQRQLRAIMHDLNVELKPIDPKTTQTFDSLVQIFLYSRNVINNPDHPQASQMSNVIEQTKAFHKNLVEQQAIGPSVMNVYAQKMAEEIGIAAPQQGKARE